MQAEQVVLRRHCVGPPEPSDFAVEPLDPPALREGQFRVRHCWCSVDPGTRSRLSGGDSYAAALKLGAAVDGFSVGTIVESRNPDWPEGVRVFCAGGWKTHSVQSGRGFIGRVPDVPGVPLSAWIGVLGVPGLTAWFGLRDTARFKPGDAVLVTSAAGPVGATAGQLAGAWGASRVVGIAGSTDKCRWLTEVAGFDAAIDYKAAPDLAAAVAAEFPSGVDVLFDNVGNAMVNRVLPLMTLHGRICVSGQVADYNAPPAERAGIVNTAPFITHRVAMQGLVVFDFAPGFPEALATMAAMIGDGRLAFAEERFDGLAAMPEAFCGLFRGENFGRRVVRVGEE